MNSNHSVSHYTTGQHSQNASGSTSTATKSLSSRFPTLKAVKTLLLITVLFLALWGPYFIVHLYAVLYGLPVTYRDALELTVTWLGFTSYALNPFLYGWLNKTLREELLNGVSQCCASFRPNNRVSELGMGNNENFLEFLERTSMTPESNYDSRHNKRYR